MLDTIATEIININQVNMEELIRDVEKEKATRLLKTVMENNIKILELQKTLVIIMKRNEEERRREQKRENRRREYKKRWEKEEQRKRKKREEEEEKKRIDDKQRRVEKIRIREERKAEKE